MPCHRVYPSRHRDEAEYNDDEDDDDDDDYDNYDDGDGDGDGDDDHGYDDGASHDDGYGDDDDGDEVGDDDDDIGRNQDNNPCLKYITYCTYNLSCHHHLSSNLASQSLPISPPRFFSHVSLLPWMDGICPQEPCPRIALVDPDQSRVYDRLGSGHCGSPSPLQQPASAVWIGTVPGGRMYRSYSKANNAKDWSGKTSPNSRLAILFLVRKDGSFVPWN